MAKQLRLPDEPAYVTSLGLNGQEMAHASESQKTAFTVQYMKHLSPVEQLEMLVVPRQAHDWVVGCLWVQSTNPNVDWQHGWPLAVQTPGGADVVSVNRVDYQECRGNVQWSTAREKARSEGGGGIPHIQILRATAIDDLLASE